MGRWPLWNVNNSPSALVGTDTDIIIRCIMEYRTRDNGHERREERLSRTYSYSPGSFVLPILSATGSRVFRKVQDVRVLSTEASGILASFRDCLRQISYIPKDFGELSMAPLISNTLLPGVPVTRLYSVVSEGVP